MLSQQGRQPCSGSHSHFFANYPGPGRLALFLLILRRCLVDVDLIEATWPLPGGPDHGGFRWV